MVEGGEFYPGDPKTSRSGELNATRPLYYWNKLRTSFRFPEYVGIFTHLEIVQNVIVEF